MSEKAAEEATEEDAKALYFLKEAQCNSARVIAELTEKKVVAVSRVATEIHQDTRLALLQQIAALDRAISISEEKLQATEKGIQEVERKFGNKKK